MANDWGVTVKGFDQIRISLEKIGDMHAYAPAMREALKVVGQEASHFPPQPSRTRAKTFNTWVRELGRLPRSAFGFTRAGKATIRRAGRAVLQVSEMLGKKWKTAVPQIRAGRDYIVGRIENAASYGPFVQGERQAKFHAATGWKTARQILNEQAKHVLAIFDKAARGITK